MAFVPESSDVLWATKLVDNGKEEELTFTSPEKNRRLSLRLHLPGRHILMRGG